jgi:hypothetical protein
MVVQRIEARVYYKRGVPKNLKTLKLRIRADCKDPYWFKWLAKTFGTMPERMQCKILLLQKPGIPGCA